MLRSIAELAAYGSLAVLLTAASLSPEPGTAASSATTTDRSAPTTERVMDASPATANRGTMLFAVKGCTGCHMHVAFPNARATIGPDLTGIAERAATRIPGLDARAYVRQSLRDPAAYRITGNYPLPMPDLDLTDAQIESLTAFLLSTR